LLPRPPLPRSSPSWSRRKRRKEGKEGKKEGIKGGQDDRKEERGGFEGEEKGWRTCREVLKEG
jgi:hypothetical protein